MVSLSLVERVGPMMDSTFLFRGLLQKCVIGRNPIVGGSLESMNNRPDCIDYDLGEVFFCGGGMPLGICWYVCNGAYVLQYLVERACFVKMI